MNVLYTTKTCPKCSIVKTKLNNKNIDYTLIDDEAILEEKGYNLLPVLEVDGNVLKSMIDINDWINKQ